MRGRWWQLRKVLSLCEKYSPKDVDYAFRRALKYGAFGSRSIEGIFDGIRRERIVTGPVPVGDVLKDLLAKYKIPPVEKRPLKVYEELVNN